MALHTYLPQDRRRALARGESLPDRTSGSALFADISGFTAMTEALTREHGERRGIEAMTLRVNAVYEALIGDVERFGGSVIGFSGDAITCWFDAREPEPTQRAAQCAQAMQASMRQFPTLFVKVAVSTGPARRFAIGHPEIQLIDVVAGATVARVSMAEGMAQAGEVLIDQATATLLQAPLHGSRASDCGERFFVLDPAWFSGLQPTGPVAAQAAPLDVEVLRPWVLPFVVQRESAGQGLFVTDLRPATALFARFTGLDYDNDERAAQALEALVSQAQLVLQRHGGVLLELTIGDKGSYLYGSFGAAQVHEDDASRALRAAMALRQFFSTSPYSVQIGLASGTMRVGGYGSSTRQSFGAMGDDVNFAARLMSIAQPGEILISGRVRQAVAAEFTLEARPPMPLRGKAEPLPVFAVMGLRQQRAIRLQEPAFALPMVGREAEMALLADRLSAALQGRGQILGITAEAGMGKSRLLAEGIRLARRQQWIGYGGTCQLDGIHTPYLVWQSIWTAFFDLDPALPLRKRIRSIESELEDRAPEHAEAWPLLGAVLGLELPDNDFTRALQPKDRKALLETVLLQCLASAAHEAAGDGSGVLLVLEDLHAADPLSLDLLALVARAIEHLPVLVLLSYRPADTASPQPASARFDTLAHFGQIELNGLDAAQAEQVVRAKVAGLFPERVGAVPSALIERITSRAQGNPFYVEELLNYLHDRGIDPRNAAALAALDLPASLHSLLLSRIDQLPVSQQRSLKLASIIGRVFRATDLHDYYPALGALETLKADLRELDRLGFTPLESPDPELTYLFRHLVTLEVGYESLPHATRRQLHGLYAHYLESRYPDRVSQLTPQLAHHFVRAEVHDKACHYSRKAGEQAAAGFANDEALAHFARALQWLPLADAPARFDVLLRCEAIHDLQGQHEKRRGDLDELEALARQMDEVALAQARVATRRAKLAIDGGDGAAARVSAQRAIQLIEADDQARARACELLVDALLLDARAMFFAGEAAAARPQLDRALALAREHQYPRGEYHSLSRLGLLHWHAGDYLAAQDWLGRALQLIQAVGDARPQIDVLNNLGVVAKACSRHAQAVAHYEQAQRVARKIGDRSGEAMLFNNMGSACLVSGDFYQASKHCEQAARIFAELNEPIPHGLALINRAEAHRELGQYGLSRELSGQTLALLRTSGFRRGEAVVLENLGLVEHALGHLEQALQVTAQAMAIAHEIGSRALEASTLHHLGVIHTAAGDYAQAQQALEAASELVRELGTERPALEVHGALAQLALARGGDEWHRQALAHLSGLLPVLLPPTPTANPPFLPMGLYLVAHRALVACKDPRADTLMARARLELQTRSERIPDATLRRDYLALAEHRAIAQGVD